MTFNLEKEDKRGIIYSENNIINDVNNEFLQLTGYNSNKIIGKSLKDLSILLKNEKQIEIQDIHENYDMYIFRKDNLPLEVEVTCKELSSKNKKKYYFEKQINSVLELILHNFNNIDINKNESIAIFSHRDQILLKHNKNYTNTLSLMNISTVNLIGRKLSFSNNISDLFKEDSSIYKSGVECIGLNGIKTYWNISIKIICGYKNKKYILSTFYDVTKEIWKKKIINKESDAMKLIIENISDTINIIDKNGDYIYINQIGKDKIEPYIFDKIGISSQILYDLFIFNDINGNKIPFEDTPDQKILRGEEVIDYLIIGTSNLPTTYHECNGTTIYDSEGNIDGGILVYKDIENVYKLEEYASIKENIENVSTFYSSLSYEDFKVDYINEYAFNIIKENNKDIKSIPNIIGKNFFEFYKTTDEDLIRNIRESIKNHTSYVHKQKFINQGKTKYTKTLFQPMYNKDKKIEKVAAIGMDISDEEIANKEMEDILRTQEEIFINTSHELKTPLNLIFSTSQLLSVLLEKNKIDSIKDKLIYNNDIIIENCYRLTKLINNILDVSKIESGFYELNLSNYNIVNIIDSMVESVSEYTKSRGLKIIFDPEVEELIVALDIYKFERILLNLISNAIKFSNVENGFILISLVKKEDIVEISVEDNGIGIHEKKLDSIFEKFIQLNTSLNRVSEGNGIGLYLVRFIVELHGGTIKVESVLGQGSKFIMNFPLKTLNDARLIEDIKDNEDKIEMIKFELSDI